MQTIEINKISKVSVARLFLVIFYLVGLLGFSFELTFPLFQKLVPLNLIVSALLLFSFHNRWDVKSILLFVTIPVFGILVEIIGVNTQLFFGNYSYGESLGLKIFNTPVLIGLNWLILTYCIYSSFVRFREKWFFIFPAAAIMVGFDFILEPVAMQIDMWDWQGGIVPLKNYVDWYWVSLIIFFFMWITKFRAKNELASTLILIQFLFFLSLNFILN